MRRFFLLLTEVSVAVWLGVFGASTGFACTAIFTAPSVRLEGATEFLGTIILNCTDLPLPTATPGSFVTVTLTGVNFSPAASVPDNISTFPQPLISSTVPFTVPPVVTVGGTVASFVAFTPAAGAQTITITGLRANIANAGVAPGPILATVSLGGGLTGGPFVGAIASVQQALTIDSGFPSAPLNIGLNFSAIPTPAGAPATVAGNPDPSPTAANSLKAVFVEGFAGAFRKAANEDGGTPGLHGTRLRIQLTGIPTGIIPYAPRALRSTSTVTTGTISPVSSLTAIQRVETSNPDGSGGFVLPEAPNQFDRIVVTAGAATIVYELTTDDLGAVETITLFLALTVTPPVGAGTIDGIVSLAPVGPPTLAAARPQFSASPALPPPPVLSLSPTTLRFTAFLGGSPAPQTVSIRNAAGGTLNWTATISSITGGNWLALSPASGTGSARMSVTVNSSTLALGTYDAAITVSATGAGNSPQTVPVSLTVAPRPTLVVNPSSLSFVSVPGRDPGSQLLTISALDGVLNWTATASTASGGNWLELTATSGSTPLGFLAVVKTAGLAAGAYLGTITVSAPDATNSPQTVNVTLILGTVGTPVISLRPNSLAFAASAGRNPAPQTFEVQNAGTGVLGWRATVATQSGGNWLSVSPVTATAPSNITVTVNTAGLAAGTYSGTVTIAALPGINASNSPQVLNVGLVVDAPLVNFDGVVNAASFSADAVSPGSIASLFGLSLGRTTTLAPSTPLPTTLGGTQVLVNNAPAPLFYVSPTQINFQMPFGLSETSAEIVVISEGLRGLAGSAKIAPAAPGIFTVSASGTGPGAVLHEDFSLNSAQNPTAAGRVIQIFATGLGTTNPAIPAGQPASASPLSPTVATPVVLIGGLAAEVQFSGLAPGFVGAYQINARVPAGTLAGNAVPLQIQIGGRISNTATIAVR